MERMNTYCQEKDFIMLDVGLDENAYIQRKRAKTMMKMFMFTTLNLFSPATSRKYGAVRR
jgi:hypothetical protein